MLFKGKQIHWSFAWIREKTFLKLERRNHYSSQNNTFRNRKKKRLHLHLKAFLLDKQNSFSIWNISPRDCLCSIRFQPDHMFSTTLNFISEKHFIFFSYTWSSLKNFSDHFDQSFFNLKNLFFEIFYYFFLRKQSIKLLEKFFNNLIYLFVCDLPLKYWICPFR
jgi:hypothetical protein